MVLHAYVATRASHGDSGQYATDPPTSVERRTRGLADVTAPPAPGSPLCAMGLPRYSAASASNEVEPVPRRDLEFEMGRRRYDAQFSAGRHALFDLIVPIERALALVYRLVLRGREPAACQDHGVEIGPWAPRVALETALKAILLPASAEEMGSLWRAYAVEISDTVIRVIALRLELLGHAGPGVVEPLGVLSGMISALVARASCSARVKWFQSTYCYPPVASVGPGATERGSAR